MTERKDFKRIVRARARRTGESYSSALRNVRNARLNSGHARGGPTHRHHPHHPRHPVHEDRKHDALHTELLGFETREAHGRVVAFVSPTNPAAEVTLNRDGFTLPPGFTVEVESVDTLMALYKRRLAAQVRMIEDLDPNSAQFSVLDPSGRRVTITAGADRVPTGSGDTSRAISRVIPGVTTNDPEATRWFYVDYLGLELVWDRDGIAMLRSATAPEAQVIASTRLANPDGFDLVVGSLERLDAIYRAAQSRSSVLHVPADFREHGIRCFMVLDPSGIGVNVAALLDSGSNKRSAQPASGRTFATELAKTYDRRARAFEALIAGAPPERWSSLSPCEGWLAADVVAHVVDFSAQVLRERGFADAPRYADFGGPLAAFQATRDLLVPVLKDPATAQKVASFLHWSVGFDLPQHGWDLAVATGQDPTMDPDEVQLLWGSLNGDPANWEWQRANGWYAAPVPVPDDAPIQDRVLGLLGRDPYWAPPA